MIKFLIQLFQELIHGKFFLSELLAKKISAVFAQETCKCIYSMMYLPCSSGNISATLRTYRNDFVTIGLDKTLVHFISRMKCQGSHEICLSIPNNDLFETLQASRGQEAATVVVAAVNKQVKSGNVRCDLELASGAYNILLQKLHVKDFQQLQSLRKALKT